MTVSLVLSAALGCGATTTTVDPVDTEDPVATTVTVSPPTATFSSLGQSAALTATVLDQDGATMNGAPVSFASSATGVATVSSAGVVTAVANGSAMITASSGSAWGTAAVTVQQVAASVQVSPASIDLASPGSSTTAVAEVRDAGGATITNAILDWSSDDEDIATVDGTGLVRGVAEGSTSVSLDATSGGATVSASIPVQVGAGGVPLTITTTSLPDGVINALYTTQTLVASGGSGGYVWSLAPGSGPLPTGLALGANGQITGTPLALGSVSFTVRVTSGAESAERSLSIAITAGSAQTIFFTETFEDGNVASRGWFANTAFTRTTAEAYSGSSSLEIRYGVGNQTPTFGGAARKLFTPSESVYISYWVKFSANWIGSGQAFHPHEFALVTDEDDMWVAPTSTRLTTLIEHNYQQGVLPKISMTDQLNIDQSQIGVDLTGTTENRAAAGCNGNGDSYQTACFSLGGSYTNNKEWKATQTALTTQPGPGNQNAWHFVEVFIQLNSIQGGIGQADGIARYWVDGNLFLDHDDILFRTGAHPNMRFFEFLIAPYIGVGSPVAQTMWVDDLRVGDRR